MKKALNKTSLNAQLDKAQEKFEFFTQQFSILKEETPESLGIDKDSYTLGMQPYRRAYLAYQWAQEGIAICQALRSEPSLQTIANSPEQRGKLSKLLGNQKKKRQTYIDNLYTHHTSLAEAPIPTTFDAFESHLAYCQRAALPSITETMKKTLTTLTKSLAETPAIKARTADAAKALPQLKATIKELANRSKFFSTYIKTLRPPLDQEDKTLQFQSDIIKTFSASEMPKGIEDFNQELVKNLIQLRHKEGKDCSKQVILKSLQESWIITHYTHLVTFAMLPAQLDNELSNINSLHDLSARTDLYSSLKTLITSYQSSSKLYDSTCRIYTLYNNHNDVMQNGSVIADYNDVLPLCTAPLHTALHERNDIKTLVQNADILATFLKNVTPQLPSPSVSIPLSPTKPNYTTDFSILQGRIKALQEQAAFFLEHTSCLFKEPTADAPSNRVAHLHAIRKYAGTIITLAEKTTTSKAFNEDTEAHQLLQNVIEAHRSGSKTYPLQEAISTFYTHKADIEAMASKPYLASSAKRTERHRLYQDAKASPHDQTVETLQPMAKWVQRVTKQQQAAPKASVSSVH